MRILILGGLLIAGCTAELGADAAHKDPARQHFSLPRQGDWYLPGNELVDGFDLLCGQKAKGVDVYDQGKVGEDNDPPKYLGTIESDNYETRNAVQGIWIVDHESERMFITRDEIVYSRWLWVKKGDPHLP